MVGQADDLLLVQAQGHRVLGGLACFFVDDVEHLQQGAALRFAGQPAGQAFRSGVEPLNAAAGIGGDDGVADRLERDVQQFVLAGQLGGQCSALCDVFHRTHVARDLPTLVGNLPGPRMHLAHRAVRAQDAKLHVEFDLFPGATLPGFEYSGLVGRMQGLGPARPQALFQAQTVDFLPARIGVGAGTRGIGGIHTQRRGVAECAKPRRALRLASQRPHHRG